MFGGPFNRLPYNRPLTLEVLFSISFESESELSSRINLEIPLSVTIETESEMSVSMIRQLAFSATFESATEMLAQLTRERIFTATFESASEIVITVTNAHVDQLSFTGVFKPGDRLVIDTKKQTVTLNGENALHLIDGNFFELISGTNTLTYTDTATSRNILTRVTHSDKYLY